MEVLKLITPFLTFLLGVVSAILFKRFDKKREQLIKSLDEVRDLVNAWYNQLHEIHYELKVAPTNSIPQKYLFYINNRLVLPKLLHHLEILRRYKKAHKVVKYVEIFLSLVTDYSKQKDEQLTPSFDIEENIQKINSPSSTETIAQSDLDKPISNVKLPVFHRQNNADYDVFLQESSRLYNVRCHYVLSGSSVDDNYKILDKLLFDLDNVLQNLSMEIANLKN